jgi:hypothetical protein
MVDAIRLVLARKSAYRRLFLDALGNPTPDALMFFKDMARFCNANKPSVRTYANGVDVSATMVGEGRREVYNRIMSFLYLGDRQRTQFNDPDEN